MKTQYFDRDSLPEAGRKIANGDLVAFPTETVYGLGANALSNEAVQKIFQAKGRPSDNPLIVHIAKLDDLKDLAASISPVARILIDAFWPGPLTLVFPKTAKVPDSVTAGLSSVAIRMPSHPWALELLKYAGVPVAAPSANRSGSPSATTWQAVREDLDGRVDGIVCGPPTEIGLESTVVDTTGPRPRILRPGKITYEELVQVCPDIEPYMPKIPPINDVDDNENEMQSDRSGSPTLIENNVLLNSPGLRHRHYQPKAKVCLVSEPRAKAVLQSSYIGLQSPTPSAGYLDIQIVGNADEYGRALFDFFRRSDRLGVLRIDCQIVPEVGVGVALMDRLKRASE
jgi:L-threonylcarbamoyladenylate synthase